MSDVRGDAERRSTGDVWALPKAVHYVRRHPFEDDVHAVWNGEDDLTVVHTERQVHVGRIPLCLREIGDGLAMSDVDDGLLGELPLALQPRLATTHFDLEREVAAQGGRGESDGRWCCCDDRCEFVIPVRCVGGAQEFFELTEIQPSGCD